jgi:hypothetical protein
VIAESMGPKELAGLGLSPANAVFRVYTLPDSEEAEAAELLLAEVHIGALRGSDGVLAMSAGDDAVYLLGIEQSEYIPVSYQAFRNHFRAEDSVDEDAAAPSEAQDASD